MQVKGSVVSIKGINVQTSSIPIPSTSVTNGEVDSIPNINISAKDGKDGKDGKSAYEQAVDGGFVGTEQEFTDALNGNVKGIDTLLNAYDENIAMQLQTITG
jgi:hypothetical protein